MRYTVRTGDGSAIQVVTDQTEIHLGDCVLVEETSNGATVRRKDPSMWGLYAYTLLETGDRDRALSVVSEGLKVIEGSSPLKELKAAIANNRMKKFKWGKAFGQGWYSFWPEQIPKKQLQAAQQGQMRGRKSYPQQRR